MGALSKAKTLPPEQQLKLPSPDERENMIYFAELRGDPIPPLALAEECETCEGHGTEVCPECEGDKEHACHCSECGDDHWRSCDTCSGKGHVGICEPCKGTGVVMPAEESARVPEGALPLPFDGTPKKPTKRPRKKKARAR